MARLIDFCFGGDLIETPALQSEFVAARLFATIGDNEVVFERDRLSSSAARVTWRSSAPGEATEHPRSVLAPFSGERGVELLEGVVGIENLSDLIFHLANIRPISVRRSKREADTKLVRLSFRDLLFYCYLDQDNLDSSFFAFDHPFKKQKSIDAMRFFVGFYSERLNDQEQRLYRAIEEQRTKRSTADQLSSLFKDLNFSNEAELEFQLHALSQNRTKLRAELEVVEGRRSKQSHPLDVLRSRLRELAERINAEEVSLGRLNEKVSRRESLKAELVTAKVKALRAGAAQRVLSQVEFQRCPQCETPVEAHRHGADTCSLCGQTPVSATPFEQLASEFDERVDELEDLVSKQKREASAQERRVQALRQEKSQLDARLSDESKRYDEGFVARLRELERGLAEADEKEKHLQQMRRVPETLARLLKEAGELQGEIDTARKAIDEETQRLRNAQTVVQDLQSTFKALLLRVGFPGMSPEDNVVVDTESWEPRVFGGKLSWGFNELGSGGKKVLFKVLYALALHELAAARSLPLPTLLIVDSPTKNISHDVNPELFEAFYREVFRAAKEQGATRQFILIDSELVKPKSATDLGASFSERLLGHSEAAPPLISYYRGP